jgi:hypothetical protein
MPVGNEASAGKGLEREKRGVWAGNGGWEGNGWHSDVPKVGSGSLDACDEGSD